MRYRSLRIHRAKEIDFRQSAKIIYLFVFYLDKTDLYKQDCSVQRSYFRALVYFIGTVLEAERMLLSYWCRVPNNIAI